jgi:purine nucleosidase
MAISQHPVILDTDIGTDVDDVVALGVILRSPELDLRAVTTVYVDTVLRARMVEAVLAVAGRSDIPVGAGVGAPLLNRDPLVWGGWEGAGVIEPNGETTDPAIAARTGSGSFRHGVDLLIEQVMARPGELTILAIGPLTNLATAIVREPRFARAVRRFVIMGGLVQRRIDQLHMSYVEHNIRCDPEAAQIVFQSGAPTTIVPLDVTTLTRIRRADLARVANADALGALVADQLDRHMRHNQHDWTTPHDPLAVAALVHPTFVRTRPMYIQVETQGQYTRAETVAILADQSPNDAAPAHGAVSPIDVALEVDVTGFESWLIDALSSPKNH